PQQCNSAAIATDITPDGPPRRPIAVLHERVYIDNITAIIPLDLVNTFVWGNYDVLFAVAPRPNLAEGAFDFFLPRKMSVADQERLGFRLGNIVTTSDAVTTTITSTVTKSAPRVTVIQDR